MTSFAEKLIYPLAVVGLGYIGYRILVSTQQGRLETKKTEEEYVPSFLILSFSFYATYRLIIATFW